MGRGLYHLRDGGQMFLNITPAEEARLPRYTGEMELTNHSAGSLTSQAYQKRWIRQNELLADAAEKSSIAAQWLGRSGPIHSKDSTTRGRLRWVRTSMTSQQERQPRGRMSSPGTTT